MKWRPTSRRPLSCWISALLTGAASAGGVSYTYDSAGRLIKADYGQGRTIAYAYSNSGSLLERRVTGLSTNVPQGTLFRFSDKGSDGMDGLTSDQGGAVVSSSTVAPQESSGILARLRGLWRLVKRARLGRFAGGRLREAETAS